MSIRDRGRPKASSRAAIEDAAAELFLEQGYTHTSVDDIAQRAGISRATFFNYCPNKSDVLWMEADFALASLELQLRRNVALGEALRTLALMHPREKIPLIATQSEAMGLGVELAASAGIRMERLRVALSGSGVEAADVWIVLGAIVSALYEWAQGGSPRANLQDVLEQSLMRIRGILGSESVASLF
jgi:AcrR family transcriptional regulator